MVFVGENNGIMVNRLAHIWWQKRELKPLAAKQIEPRLCSLLFLLVIFREVVGEEEEKEEGSRLHIFQPLLSAPTSRAQHRDKERGSVI